MTLLRNDASFNKKRYLFWLVLNISFFGCLVWNVEGTPYYSIIFKPNVKVTSPSLILQNAAVDCILYTANTSARVSVVNETDGLNVLKVLNKTNEDWMLQLIRFDENNVIRLTNCTIWLHNGNMFSKQIQVLNGAFTQTNGTLYTFVGGGVDYITITAYTNTTGTSYIHTYLKIIKANTSTYALYIITFEIN
jgi:hypothetical protein